MDGPEERPGEAPKQGGGGGSYWDTPHAGAEKPDWQPPSGSSDTRWESPERGPQSPAGGQRPGGQQQTPGNAVASLVLGILGLVLCPIICSVIAIILGQQAKQQIERDPNLGGAGLAQAGVIMGIVGLALYGLVLAFWIVAIALAG